MKPVDVSILWTKKPDWSLFFVALSAISFLVVLLYLANEQMTKMKDEIARLREENEFHNELNNGTRVVKP